MRSSRRFSVGRRDNKWNLVVDVLGQCDKGAINVTYTHTHTFTRSCGDRTLLVHRERQSWSERDQTWHTNRKCKHRFVHIPQKWDKRQRPLHPNEHFIKIVSVFHLISFWRFASFVTSFVFDLTFFVAVYSFIFVLYFLLRPFLMCLIDSDWTENCEVKQAKTMQEIGSRLALELLLAATA